MNKYKLAIMLSALAGISINASAKITVNTSPNTKGGVVKTVTESWQLSDEEKKNTVMMMSQLSAVAIAPTVRIKKGNWTPVISQHKACFYNTFGSTIPGKYMIKFNVAGAEVTAFDVVPVGAGQGFCVTRYLELLVKGQRAGDTPSVASTHAEMDGNATDNEGHGTITVR